MRDRWQVWRRDVLAKGGRYWLFAFGWIAFGLALSNYCDSHYLLLEERYSFYRLLQHTTSAEMGHAQRVVLVAVGDDEFWTGELEQRIPIKRDYLARLVKALDDANPEALAIDYALRSPVADGGLVETPAYRGETQVLIAAIEGARNSMIVLPATVDRDRFDPSTDTYPVDSSIFGNYRFANPNVRWGYVNLPRDIRRVPLALHVRGRSTLLPSFSQQIAEILDPDSHSTHHPDGVLFGSFMRTKGFHIISASDVLAHPRGAWRQRVRCRAVVIASFAHRDAFNQGPFRDAYITPMGEEVPGAVVHANYVEALVRERYYPVSPALASDVAELVLSVVIAVLFAREMKAFKKGGYFVLFLASAFVISYFLMKNLGIFLDPVLPVLAVAAHNLFERAFDREPKNREAISLDKGRNS